MMDPLTYTGSRLGINAISKIASDIYELIKTKTSESVKKWRAQKGIDDLYARIESVRKVKTIWQIDHNVDLQDFFCPPHLIIDAKRVRADSLEEMAKNEPILIEGIAGQGKSIYLRHICAQEMILGNTVPIFIELRRIEKGDSILSHSVRFLSVLGIELTEELIKDLLKISKVTLFLDGFDEVSEEARGSIINEIEMICQLCNGKRLIVTSRPNSPLRNSPQLTVIKLDNLKKNEYKEVIYKISDSREYAESIIALVEEHKGDIKSLLCTPLLVTLLVVSYKSYQQIPTKLPDFYNGLFQILLQRHDGSKPNFVRKRLSKLNDSLFRVAFENLCFHTKRLRKESFNYGEMISCAKQALESINQPDVAPEGFLKDVSDITCLVVHDGEEFLFIHKSVQEFFVASYICEKPEEHNKKFYQGIAKSGFSTRWLQELAFLEEIDRYRYYKFFLIPQTKQLFGITSNLSNTQMPSAISGIQRNLFDPFTITIAPAHDDAQSDQKISISIEFEDAQACPIPGVVYKITTFCVMLAAKSMQEHKSTLGRFMDKSGHKYILPLKQISSQIEFKEEISNFATKEIKRLFEEAKLAEEYLKREDQFMYEKDLFGY